MFRLDINKRLIRYKTRFRHYELTRLTRFYSNHLLLSEPLNLSSMFHHENELFFIRIFSTNFAIWECCFVFCHFWPTH